MFVADMNEAQYPIRLVARLTGLSAHVIRIWEQRYRAVEPQRTSTKRRLYSQRDIERLNLLRDLTQAGHSIGQVAQLPMDKLRKLVAKSPKLQARAPRAAAKAPAASSFLDECVAAIKSFDASALDDALKRGATALGALGLLQRVVAPLAQTVGDLWRDGTLTAAHEHFASAALRVFLGQAAKPFGAVDNAPVLVVATPAGQVHELGALLVGATAANLGWQVTYLGASLPAAEIAGAAQQRRARAVALSLVYPEDDPQLEGAVTLLRESLPGDVKLLAGGRAMPAYREALEKVGALPIENLAQLGATLDGLRKPTRPNRAENPVGRIPRRLPQGGIPVTWHEEASNSRCAERQHLERFSLQAPPAISADGLCRGCWSPDFASAAWRAIRRGCREGLGWLAWRSRWVTVSGLRHCRRSCGAWKWPSTWFTAWRRDTTSSSVTLLAARNFATAARAANVQRIVYDVLNETNRET